MTRRRVATATAVAAVVVAWVAWRWFKIPTDDGLWLEQPPDPLPYAPSGIPPFYMGRDLRGRIVKIGE